MTHLKLDLTGKQLRAIPKDVFSHRALEQVWRVFSLLLKMNANHFMASKLMKINDLSR